MKKRSESLSDWLGFSRFPDFTKARWLGGLVSVLGTTLIAAVVSLLLIRFFAALIGFKEFQDAAVQSTAIRNTGLVLAALIGVPFLVWRSFVAQKQVDIAEQGQITDRINKSVQGLGAEKTTKTVHETPRYRVVEAGKWERDEKGNPVPALRPDGDPIVDREVIERTEPNLEVRLGAIFALERIAQDSIRDHIQIMEILTTYIRENAPNTIEKTEPLTNPRADIQAALSVIGRRTNDQLGIERSTRHHWGQDGFQLNLTNSCLNKANLTELNFDNARFTGSQLRGARLQRASLQNADFSNCDFSDALLEFANFSGSKLWYTDLTSAKFENLYLDGASMRSTKISTDIIRINASICSFFLDETVLNRSYPYAAFMFENSDTYQEVEQRREELRKELGVQKYPSDKDAHEAWREWQIHIGVRNSSFPRWDG